MTQAGNIPNTSSSRNKGRKGAARMVAQTDTVGALSQLRRSGRRRVVPGHFLLARLPEPALGLLRPTDRVEPVPARRLEEAHREVLEHLDLAERLETHRERCVGVPGVADVSGLQVAPELPRAAVAGPAFGERLGEGRDPI